MNEKVTSAAAGAVIVVDGIIGRPSGSGSVNTAGEMAEAIDRAVCSGEREATVDIRSTGGDVHEALGMYDILAGSGLRITTRCFGYVASAATIVAQAASPGRRLIAPGALYLIHRAESAAEGNAGDMTAAVELLTKTDAGIAGIYAARSGRSAREFAALMNENGGRGKWLTASETVAAGLADSVIPVRVRGEADPVVWLRRAAGELCSMLGIAPLPLAAGADTAEELAGGSADDYAGGAGMGCSAFGGKTFAGDVPDRPALGGVLTGPAPDGGAVAGDAPDCLVPDGRTVGSTTARRLRDTAAGDVLESVRRLLRRLLRWPTGSGTRAEDAGPAVVAAPAGDLGAEACGAGVVAADRMAVSQGAGECGESLRNAGGDSAAGGHGGSAFDRHGSGMADGCSVGASVAGGECGGSECSRREAEAGGACGGVVETGAGTGSAGLPAAGGDDGPGARAAGMDNGPVGECSAGRSAAPGAATDSAPVATGNSCRGGGPGGDSECSSREAEAGGAAEGHADGTDSAECAGGGMLAQEDRLAAQSSVVACADGEPGAGSAQGCLVSDSAAPRWLPVEQMLKRQASARRTRTVEVEDPSPQGDETMAGNDEAYRLDALGISGR